MEEKSGSGLPGEGKLASRLYPRWAIQTQKGFKIHSKLWVASPRYAQKEPLPPPIAPDHYYRKHDTSQLVSESPAALKTKFSSPQAGQLSAHQSWKSKFPLTLSKSVLCLFLGKKANNCAFFSSDAAGAFLHAHQEQCQCVKMNPPIGLQGSRLRPPAWSRRQK